MLPPILSHLLFHSPKLPLVSTDIDSRYSFRCRRPDLDRSSFAYGGTKKRMKGSSETRPRAPKDTKILTFTPFIALWGYKGEEIAGGMIWKCTVVGLCRRECLDFDSLWYLWLQNKVIKKAHQSRERGERPDKSRWADTMLGVHRDLWSLTLPLHRRVEPQPLSPTNHSNGWACSVSDRPTNPLN